MSGDDGARLERILARLGQFYGPMPEPPRDAFAHFLWHILWLRTTPQGRDAALLALRRVPALTPDSIAKAAPAKVEAALLLAGSHSPERRRLLAAGIDEFRRRPDLGRRLGGSVLAARRAFRWLGPMNPATVGWLLLFVGDHPVLPLDARILRVAWRLGWGRAGGSPRRWQRSSRQAVLHASGRDLAMLRRTALLFAHHGTSACDDLSPRCGICPLSDDCPRGPLARD
jgi:endonuclease III